MKDFLRKVFGIYPGEGIHALRFVRLAILWAFGSSTLDTLSDGLFLENIGATFLPRVYLIIALSMIGVSSIVIYSLKATSPYRILNFAMAYGVLLCIGSAFFVSHTPPDWFWYALKIASRVFFAVMIAISWTFTDQYHDLQDAKRVYSLYSAAYFLGTIFAGLSINFFLDKIGFSGLLIAACFSILAGMGVAKTIAFHSKAVYDDSVEGVFSGSRNSFSSVVQLISRSRFAITLLLLSLVTQLMITVTEFNYMESFGAHFKSPNNLIPEGHIAEFLGKCRAWISFCNILVGVFLFGRLLRRSGLTNVILITPLFFISLYCGWVFNHSLGLAILGLIAVDGILFNVEDNCFNLLSNAVPTKLKSRVRIINDSFFEPIGLLLSSLLLFCVQSGSKWLGFALASGVLILTFIIRGIYSSALLLNLKDNAIHFERSFRSCFQSQTRREQKETKLCLFKALKEKSEEGQLFAIEALLQLGDFSALEPILKSATKLGTLSKIRLMRLFENSPYTTDSRLLETINEWVEESQSLELSKWASFYLAKRGFHHPEKMEDDLDHPDLLQKAAAILTLRKSLANPTLEYAALNRTIAAKKLDIMLKSSRIDEVSMALDILAEENSLESADRALAFLSHDSILVKRSASRCLAALSNKNY